MTNEQLYEGSYNATKQENAKDDRITLLLLGWALIFASIVVILKFTGKI